MSVVTGQEADRFKNQYCCRLSVAQHLCAVFQSALCRCASYPSRAKLSRMNLRLGVQAGFVPAGLFKWPQCHHKPFIRKLADRARRARCTLKDSMASAPSSTSAPSATSACVAPRARPCLVRMRQDVKTMRLMVTLGCTQAALRMVQLDCQSFTCDTQSGSCLYGVMSSHARARASH